VGRWAAAILVLTFTTSAWAEEELQMPVPVKVDATAVSATPAAEPAVRPKRKKQSVRAVLGSLAIARDLQFPGSTVMAVRLLPTSSALAGETTTPIVVRPRVDGGYGVNIAARF
jgi:hypothetical protein